MMMRISPRTASGATLAELRRATAPDHQSVDALVIPDRLVEIGYYTAVLRGLSDATELVEATLPLIPRPMWGEGLSPAEVSKRVALDAESSFLDDLAGARLVPRPPSGDEGLTTSELRMSGPPVRGTMLGLLYVYVGSALGGLHLLRVARTAPWWRHEREHLLLRPYGHHLAARWRAVLSALERLDPQETTAVIAATLAGFEVYRRSLADQLSCGGYR